MLKSINKETGSVSLIDIYLHRYSQNTSDSSPFIDRISGYTEPSVAFLRISWRQLSWGFLLFVGGEYG